MGIVPMFDDIDELIDYLEAQPAPTPIPQALPPFYCMGHSSCTFSDSVVANHLEYRLAMRRVGIPVREHPDPCDQQCTECAAIVMRRRDNPNHPSTP